VSLARNRHTKMRRDLTTQVSDLDELLKESDGGDPQIAIDRFNSLCERGCDRQTLGALLLKLASYWRAQPLNLRSRIVDPYPLDTKRSLDPQDNKPAFTYKELQEIASRVQELKSDIHRLRKTPLVQYLKLHRVIPPDDLLYAPGSGSQSLYGLMRLPQLAKTLSPTKRPEFSRILSNIYSHIHYSTGGHYHDDLVTEILQCLRPEDGNPTFSREALKEWRKRHRLTDKQNRQRQSAKKR
jgi:hypothetical protein